VIGLPNSLKKLVSPVLFTIRWTAARWKSYHNQDQEIMTLQVIFCQKIISIL